MSEALQYLYYFYDKFIDFIFNDMEFFSNVTFGWIMVTVIVFGIMFFNVINVPVNGRIGTIKDGDDSHIGIKHGR